MILKKLFLLAIAAASLGFMPKTGLQAQSPNPIIIRLQFTSSLPGTVAVNPATLKYNKDFAYCIAFDDGLDDTYLLAFRLMNGGRSSVDQNTYTGLFYTDGCGKPIPFRGGVSWYTANSAGVDLHRGTQGYMTYAQAVEMYQSGWDFYNHSYNHEAGQPGTDFLWQLQNNHNLFKNNTGIEFRYCVPPSQDTRYIDPAFSMGYLACITSEYGHPGSVGGVDASMSVPASRPVYWRDLINSDDDNLETLKTRIDQWVSTTGKGRQKWCNDFTHRVAYNRVGASLEFQTFRAYMEYLESRYGKGGQDNGWFTHTADVIDYLLVRDNIRITVQSSGNLMEIRIDYGYVPRKVRNYDISLILGTGIEVTSSTVLNGGVLSVANKQDHTLVNMDLPDSYYSGVGDNFEYPEFDQPVAFPNPTRGIIRFRDPSGKPMNEVFLFRQDGSRVPTPPISYSSEGWGLDLSGPDYPAGTYFILWSDPDGKPARSRFVLIK